MALLPSYRNKKILWQQLAYSPVPFDSADDSDRTYDAHAKARYTVLIELQYDLQTQDEALVRYLFTQEILNHQENSIWGVSDALVLNAYLLASFKNPDDIPLFYNAKHSNFDASFVIDNEFMFYALKDKTALFVKDSFPDIHDDLQELYSQYSYAGALEEWWTQLSSSYPKQESDEDLYTLYQRHLYLDNDKRARNYLEAWRKITPDSHDKRNTLKHAYIELKEYLQVIELLKEELAGSESHWDNVSCYRELLDLYTKTKQSENALKTINAIDDELNHFTGWKNTGLGFTTLEKIFEFSLLTDHAEYGIEAFNTAYKRLGDIKYSLPYTGLETAMKAAKKYELALESNELEKRLMAEKNRINKEFVSNSWFKSLYSKFFS